MSGKTDPNFYFGEGEFTLPNGDSYKGCYGAHRTGLIWREGYGIYRTSDGQTYEGEWKNDKLLEKCEVGVTYPSGVEYHGCTLKNKYHGAGTYVLESKMDVSCCFEANKPVGVISMIDCRGRVWTGTSSDNNAVLLPESVFYASLTKDLGKGSLEHEATPPQETVEEESEFLSDSEWEKIIFAKTDKTASNNIIEDELHDQLSDAHSVLTSETNKNVKIEYLEEFKGSSRGAEEEEDEIEHTSSVEDTKSSEKLGDPLVKQNEKAETKREKLSEDEASIDHKVNSTQAVIDEVMSPGENVDMISIFRSKAFARSCPAVPVFYPSSNRSENDSEELNVSNERRPSQREVSNTMGEQEVLKPKPSCEDIDAPHKLHFTASREQRLRNVMKFGKPDDVGVQEQSKGGEVATATSSGGKDKIYDLLEERVKAGARDVRAGEERFEERLKVYVQDFVARKVAERQRLKKEEPKGSGLKLHLHSVATSIGSDMHIPKRSTWK